MANFIMDDVRRIFTSNNSLSKIILATTISFIVTNLLQYAFPIKNWLAMQGAATDFILQPWGIVSYMFLHAGIFHILFNMWWLHSMGKILLDYLGDKRFTAVYFLGGIAGALCYLVAYNILLAFGVVNMGSMLIGASAGVMAVVFAVATLLPEFEVAFFLLGRIKMKYVALGILVLTSFLDFSINMGGKLAHIGGAAVGYLFIKNMQKGNDWSQSFHAFVSWIKNLVGFGGKRNMRVVSNRQKTKRRQGNYGSQSQREKADSVLTAAQKQKKIDSILDKISQSGYDSLSEEEKAFLFKASDKH